MPRIGYDNLSPEFKEAIALLVDESEAHGLSLDALRKLNEVPAFRYASCYRAKNQLTEDQYWDIVQKLKALNGIA